MNEEKLFCQKCGKEYAGNERIWRCFCGGLLDIAFAASFDLQQIKERPYDLWRYREAIPIQNNANIISFQEGFSPLIPFDFNDQKILIKQDHLFQTGSYKDRGAAVMISKAVELGIRKVVEDSSGNAGCAVAAYCARAGIECDIYVPAKTSPGKLAQIERYGAKLHLIPGSREDTARAVLAAAEENYYASHSWNPYFFQGTKTFAYEIWEQLDWQAPDAVILPAGNGTLLLGTYFGFNDLIQAGMIEKMPTLFAVQSENCAPLYTAYLMNEKRPARLTVSETIAEGIAIAKPVRGEQMLLAVQDTGGAFVAVNEIEIKTALSKTHLQGFYIEPTAAAAIAAIPHLMNTYNHLETWVSVFTGHGLKSTEKFAA